METLINGTLVLIIIILVIYSIIMTTYAVGQHLTSNRVINNLYMAIHILRTEKDPVKLKEKMATIQKGVLKKMGKVT